jgi:hypothetical protein
MNTLTKLCNLPLVGGLIGGLVATLPFLVIYVIIKGLNVTAISDAQLVSLGGVLVLAWNYFVLRHQGLNIVRRVLPFIPIPFWIIGIIWVGIGTWHTYDAMRVSFFDSNDTPFTIESVEKHGVGGKRFIRITDGRWGSPYVYEYGMITQQVEFVVFPIVSQATWNLLSSEQPATIRVLVKKDVDHLSVARLEDWAARNGAMSETVDIEGIVRIGFDSLDDRTKGIIQSAKLKLHENFILIEGGIKPSPLILSVLLFLISIGGIVLSLFVIKVRMGESAIEETT